MRFNNYQQKFKKIQHDFMAFVYRKDLRKLATLYGTNKWNQHWYAQHYNNHFKPFRLKRMTILEIGVEEGRSLRMWKRYFPKGMIYGIDIVNQTHLEEDRIKIFQGSQDDEYFLKKIVAETGELDIIIDDGSHQNQHVIKSFNLLFPTLNNGGIYVVEDTFSSYAPSLDEKWLKYRREGDGENWWAKMGGSTDLNDPKTMMSFFKRRVDFLNYQEILHPGYSPSYFDKHIVAIHFYHNLVFIYKGNNNEEGIFLEKNIIKPSRLQYLGIESFKELGIEPDSIESLNE